MDSLTTNAFPMDVTLGAIVFRIALGLLGLSIPRHPGSYRCTQFPLDA
jgi:hypothetical protein